MSLIRNYHIIKKAKVTHGFFTRLNGCSKNDFRSLNCSISNGDNKKLVLKNRQKALKNLGLQNKKLILINQIHSSKVVLINNSNINKYLNSSIIDGNIGKITINVNEGNERNSLEVVFDYPKPVLRQWKYIDHQKKETNIFFSKLNFVESVQKQYFVTK